MQDMQITEWVQERNALTDLELDWREAMEHQTPDADIIDAWCWCLMDGTNNFPNLANRTR